MMHVKEDYFHATKQVMANPMHRELSEEDLFQKHKEMVDKIKSPKTVNKDNLGGGLVQEGEPLQQEEEVKD